MFLEQLLNRFEQLISNLKFHIWELIYYICMRVIAKKTLKEFYEKNAESKQSLLIWFKEVNNGKWKNHSEMKEYFSSLCIIPNERIVFNIKGNKYRIVAKVNYDYQIIWIRFVGTHGEYDKIDATKI